MGGEEESTSSFYLQTFCDLYFFEIFPNLLKPIFFRTPPHYWLSAVTSANRFVFLKTFNIYT